MSERNNPSSNMAPTASTAVTQSAIVKEGWIHKKGHGDISQLSNWKHRFFILKENGQFAAFRSKPVVNAKDLVVPDNNYSVKGCQIITGDNFKGFKFMIRLLHLTKKKMVDRNFYVESEQERKDWLQTIEKVRQRLEEDLSTETDPVPDLFEKLHAQMDEKLHESGNKKVLCPMEDCDYITEGMPDMLSVLEKLRQHAYEAHNTPEDSHNIPEDSHKTHEELQITSEKDHDTARSSAVSNIITVINQNIAITNLGVDKNDSLTFVKFLGEKEEELQKLIRLKEENMLKLPSINMMTRSTCLLRYRGKKRMWHGTGFLAKLPGFGIALLSAGHNFEHKGKLLDNFDNFVIMMNNIDGYLYPKDAQDITTKKMSDFIEEFGATVVITYKGKQLVKKAGEASQVTEHTNQKLDYFALLLTHSDSEKRLKSQKLEILETAPDEELKNTKEGEPVYIFGHPGLDGQCESCKNSFECKCKNQENISHCLCKENCSCCHPAEFCSCEHPMRFSHGNLKRITTNHLHYDMDTRPGNSGSAASGKDYQVKGIHVKSSGKWNAAQCLLSVLQDLNRIFPGGFEKISPPKKKSMTTRLKSSFSQEKFEIDNDDTEPKPPPQFSNELFMEAKEEEEGGEGESSQPTKPITCKSKLAKPFISGNTIGWLGVLICIVAIWKARPTAVSNGR